jgi:hypothetical protein
MTREFVQESPAAAAPRPVDPDRVPLAATEISRRSGPAAAVVLAAGLASFVLGLLSVLTAVSPSVSSALTLSDRVGDLSGLTTAVAVVFFAAWGVLAIMWRRADPSLVRVAAASGVLIGLGLLGTFPPFFNALGG